MDEEAIGGVPAAFGAGGGETTRPCSMSLYSSFKADDDIVIVYAKMLSGIVFVVLFMRGSIAGVISVEPAAIELCSKARSSV